MRNYIFLIRQTNRRPQKIRVRSITDKAARVLATAIMDSNGLATVTYWAE